VGLGIWISVTAVLLAFSAAVAELFIFRTPRSLIENLDGPKVRCVWPIIARTVGGFRHASTWRMHFGLYPCQYRIPRNRSWWWRRQEAYSMPGYGIPLEPIQPSPERDSNHLPVRNSAFPRAKRSTSRQRGILRERRLRDYLALFLSSPKTCVSERSRDQLIV